MGRELTSVLLGFVSKVIGRNHSTICDLGVWKLQDFSWELKRETTSVEKWLWSDFNNLDTSNWVFRRLDLRYIFIYLCIYTTVKTMASDPRWKTCTAPLSLSSTGFCFKIFLSAYWFVLLLYWLWHTYIYITAILMLYIFVNCRERAL